MRDMTRGSIRGHLLSHALPMILGNYMQLTYNAADSVIVGKSLGENALAAVSTVNPVMTMMVLFSSGIGIGASVLMSRFFGAGEKERLKREFATTVLFSALFSLLLTLLGLLFIGPILTALSVPDASAAMAGTYFSLILVGFPFSFLYNILAAAIRSTGDSKTPMALLAVSCLLNILLDLLFVRGMGMGVAGAALATALCQIVSAMMCFFRIQSKMPALALSRKGLRMDGTLLRETLQSGSITALQQVVQPLGKLLIQGVINGGGVTVMGAFNAVCRVDDFACIPAQSIGSSVMTCTAQNRGAGEAERMRGTLRQGLLVGLCYFPVICGLTLLLRGPVIGALCPDNSTAMVRMGVEYLGVKAWLFLFPCVNNVLQGYMRGLGRMGVTLAATALQISLRTLGVFLLVPKIGIVGEAWACMAGWACMLLFEGGYLLRLRKNGRA